MTKCLITSPPYAQRIFSHKIESINHLTGSLNTQITNMSQELNPVSNQYPLTISAKIQATDGGFVYLPVSEDVMNSMWSLASTHVQTINTIVKKDGTIPNKLVKREANHKSQPFHSVLPHFSIAYKTKHKNPLALIKQNNGDSLDLKLAFKVSKIKLVPPTKNGILSLVYTVEFDNESQHIMSKIVETLEERPQHAWHITVGQSFYEPETAQCIFDLYSKHNIDILRIDERSKADDHNVGSCWRFIKGQEKYFKEKLMPRLERKGYPAGYYNDAKDHVVLFDETAPLAKCKCTVM